MIPFLELTNSEKWVLQEWGFIFCLRLRRHFFRHTDFRRFKISKKFILKNLDFRHHRNIYRLGPCIPIFSFFFFFLIESTKRMCICQCFKNRISTF